MLYFAIGAGLDLLVNLYMPSKQTYRYQVDEKLRLIRRRFEPFLLADDGSNDGLLIGELDVLLSQALALVYYRDRHHQLFQQTNNHVHYFEMRQAQGRLLRQMAELANCLDEQSAEGGILAQLFSETASRSVRLTQDRHSCRTLTNF